MESNEPAGFVLSPSEDEEACLHAMHLATYSTLQWTLMAVIELGALEAITKFGRHLSPAELASELQLPNPDAPVMLDRMLRLLASYSILTYTLKTHPDDGSVSRLYGPAPVCKYLTPSKDGVSMASLCLFNRYKASTGSWCHLKDAVSMGGDPFNRANGMTLFEYLSKDMGISKVFNDGMSNHSTITVKKLLEVYDGFSGLSTLVDVGGGVGTTLRIIRSKYPEIKGKNFDLPHVVGDALELPGVEHVGGDMFESVPSGDAIFVKWILHDWDDDHCLRLLKNSYKALPNHGKVIIVESVLLEAPETDIEARNNFQFDMLMMVHCPGGKERTMVEYEHLAKAAGFSGFKVAAHVVHTGTHVLELTKY